MTTFATPIAPEHIGYPVRCAKCGRAGEIDDVTSDGVLIIRHSADAWCTMGKDEMTLQLERNG